MSFLDRTKEFFGLGPMDIDNDDAYYAEERRYEANGSAAYAPRAVEYERPQETFVPTIVALSLTGYKNAAEIGEPFREGHAVVFELTDADKANAKRLIDFAAGLCYALRGQMVKLTEGMDTDRLVFALTPQGSHFSVIALEREAGLR